MSGLADGFGTLLAGIGWLFGFVGFGLMLAIACNGLEVAQGIRELLSRPPVQNWPHERGPGMKKDEPSR